MEDSSERPSFQVQHIRKDIVLGQSSTPRGTRLSSGVVIRLRLALHWEFSRQEVAKILYASRISRRISRAEGTRMLEAQTDGRDCAPRVPGAASGTHDWMHDEKAHANLIAAKRPADASNSM